MHNVLTTRYNVLTTRELTILQDMLFAGTERAFWVASEDGLDSNAVSHYRAAHREIAHIFIEVATELVGRLDHAVQAA